MSNKITITATVNANANKVWDYYTQPQHITKWNFADPSWHCPSAFNDMHVGGKYKARMEAKDGSFGFDLEATYKAIKDGESFTCTMPNGRQVDAIFKKDNGKTDVTISFDPEDENSSELQKTGWQAIIDNFKKYTEAN